MLGHAAARQERRGDQPRHRGHQVQQEHLVQPVAQHLREQLPLRRRQQRAARWVEQCVQLARASRQAPADLRAGTTVEDYGSIANASAYRRVTTIADSPGGTCEERCKLAQVTVFYRPVTGSGQLDQERRLDVVTMLVSRI